MHVQIDGRQTSGIRRRIFTVEPWSSRLACFSLRGLTRRWPIEGSGRIRYEGPCGIWCWVSVLERDNLGSGGGGDEMLPYAGLLHISSFNMALDRQIHWLPKLSKLKKRNNDTTPENNNESVSQCAGKSILGRCPDAELWPNSLRTGLSVVCFVQVHRYDCSK